MIPTAIIKEPVLLTKLSVGSSGHILLETGDGLLAETGDKLTLE